MPDVHPRCMAWKRLVFIWAACWLSAAPGAAQSARPGYHVACLPREQFVSRLRSLVKEPEHVEVALTAFWISASADGESSWSLSIERLDAAPAPPRILHDTGCSAVAEAAVLVVSAWIDEREPQPLPAAPKACEASGLDAWGISWMLDGYAAPMPGALPAAIGGGVGVFFMDPQQMLGFNLRYFPERGRLGVPAGRYAYMSSDFELSVDGTRFWASDGPLHLGAVVSVAYGSHRKPDGAFAMHAQGGLGLRMRWELGKQAALRYDLAVAVVTFDALRPRIVSTLGLEFVAP